MLVIIRLHSIFQVGYIKEVFSNLSKLLFLANSYIGFRPLKC